MKKFIAIAVAVLLVALSALPVFAESLNSPIATKANYVIHTSDDIEGGKIVAQYETAVGEDGRQTILLQGIPEEGYDFGSWIIDGNYVPQGNLTDSVLKIVISSDITVKAVFNKSGAPTTAPVTPEKKIVDDGSKSPQTGSTDYVAYAVMFSSIVALIALAVVARRRSKKK